MKKNIEINGQLSFSYKDIAHIARNSNSHLSLSQNQKSKISRSCEFVDQVIKSGKVVYGINTGFGALASKKISNADLESLQYNLIRSHCTGVGQPFSVTLTRAILTVRTLCLARGHSGVSLTTLELLLDFINHQIHPIIPQKGSVGASGDLAPLAHMALALIGEGDVLFDGKIIKSDFAIHSIGKQPLKLRPKEGLALINGTTVMTSLAALAVFEAERLFKIADIAACYTLEALRGTRSAFHPLITSLRPQIGQSDVVFNLNKILTDSEISSSHKDCGKVQDPYSLRCVPQVHGAARQTFNHAKDIVNIEINSVTDNPLIFPDEDLILSGGNFHGQPIAFIMDYLAMGFSEIGSISERRVEKLMNPSFSDLPAFLIKDNGLNSGLMIAHVTSAALASENKTMCFPASVDNIPTSTDKEDHVSMGVTSGRKLHDIIENIKYILAIELLCAFQGVELLSPLKPCPSLLKLHLLLKKHIKPITNDRVFSHDFKKIVELIESDEIINAVESIVGELR